MKDKKILNIFAEMYFFIIIVIYPLIVDSTGFFHILECKWYSYLIITVTYIALNILVIVYLKFFKGINIFSEIKLKKVHYFALIFLLVNIVSVFFSPFFNDYDLFMGVGRGEGLLMTSLYIISFLLVSLFLNFKKRHIMYFTISLLLLNTVGILQYIGFNPFNMYQNGIGTHNVSFFITIGNVDFVSAVYCILLIVSIYSFIFLKEKKYEKVLHLIAILTGFFIIGIIDVQSGKLSIIMTFFLSLPFIISSNKRLSRFSIVIAMILLAYATNIIINPEYHYDIDKLGLYFQFNLKVGIYLIVILLLIILSYFIKNSFYDFSKNKRIIKRIYIVMFSLSFIGVCIIYFYKFKIGFLYEIHEILHGNFDDNFGTYRIFLWKRSLKIFLNYPLLGTGCDTFAIRFMEKYSSDIASIGPLTLNDTAANIYLTTLVNTGILGLLSYLSFLYFFFRDCKKNIFCKVLLASVVCFLIQSFFNLSVVIVTPLFYMLLALCTTVSD